MKREQLELTAQQLRDDYTLLRQMNNSNYTPRDRDEKMWMKLAESLDRNDISPRRFIKWAYDFYKMRHPVPFVNMVTSDRAVTIFLNREPHMVDQEAETRLRCELQQATVKAELEKGRSPREIVLDSSLELGAVFRYAFACSADLRDLTERLRDQVEREVHFNPTYRKILGEFLNI